MSESMKPDASDDPGVRYAIERTLLAWVRTGLALMGLGFVVARFGLFIVTSAAWRPFVPPCDAICN
jgi:putative membrane protein